MNQERAKAQMVPQAQATILLNCKFTSDEASLILNKLNGSQFGGFSECSLALSILGKIQNATRIPAAAMGPTTGQTANIKESKPANLSELRKVFEKSSAIEETVPTEGGSKKQPVEGEKKPVVAFKPPPFAKKEDNAPIIESSPISEIEEDVDEKVDEEFVDDFMDEEDPRPGPPLRALDEARSLQSNTQKESIPPEDAPAFGVIDKTKKDGTDKYI